MATNKNITMKQYNGTDYDTLYPKTIASQVDGVVAYDTAQSLTTAQQKQARENIDIDPPAMELGVEYRTTERYLGKPVYKKLQSDNIEYWSIDEGVTWKPKSYYVRDFQFSTTDLTAGSSALPDGTVYYVYE